MKKRIPILVLFLSLIGHVFSQNIPDRSFQIGDEIQLNPLLEFEPGKYNLSSDTVPQLLDLIKVLKLHDSIVIEIGCHSNNFSNPKSGQILTQKRAESIANFLIQNGIEPKRVYPVGFENTRLTDKKDEMKMGYQRVTIRVIQQLSKSEK